MTSISDEKPNIMISLPKDGIVTDADNQKWKIGKLIGRGRYGNVYSAKDSKSDEYSYAIKIIRQGNLPSCREANFYKAIAKRPQVANFMSLKGLKTFGLPACLRLGSYALNKANYNFIITEKYGKNLWEIFLEHDKRFPKATVCKLAIQILDVLEYMHNNGFVHGDIQGKNVLLGSPNEHECNQIYLIGYDLATNCNLDIDDATRVPKIHSDNILYLSRDDHMGVHSKRGDLETLAFNMVHWIGCELPWEKDLPNISKVKASKFENYSFSSSYKFFKLCFGVHSNEDPIVKFIEEITSLSQMSIPNYFSLRQILLSGLDPGDSLFKPFKFSTEETETKCNTPQNDCIILESCSNPNETSKSNIKKSNRAIRKLPTGKKINELVPDVSIRTRRRQQQVNYREDSDEENLSPTKRNKNTEKHVTGDSIEETNEPVES
ncbi:unnamed protein product [Phyllotreta striolata]|uniref:Protein kinase domain-containing protein n=1 Tax=Phyllotreta striolata TaxID=444603 RepID=A0A9N9TNZ5_PHYSR|nr:unnamed protein product [Phyllotreta striolata]